MEIFEFEFMRKAILVGVLLAAIIPCIGVVIVLRRLSMIGDALSHTSLAGVAGGLICDINPVVGAMIACLAAAFSIEGIRKKFPRYSEMSIAVILSAGVGLAGVLSGFVQSPAGFNSFLFGSIVAISQFELNLVVVVSAVVAGSFLLLYKEWMFLSFDEEGARLAGLPVDVLNVVFTVLTAVTVSVAARTVGALIVSSMMVVPVACAMQVARSYKQTVVFAVLFAVLFTVCGLFIAFYQGLRPGGTIVLTGVVVLVFVLLLKAVVKGIYSRYAASRGDAA